MFRSRVSVLLLGFAVLMTWQSALAAARAATFLDGFDKVEME